MKNIALLAAGLLVPGLSTAAQVGIGGSVRSDDSAIYIPINVTPGFRLEPFFNWLDTETTSSGTTFSLEGRTLGVGGFFQMNLHERVQTYLGGRLGYFEAEVSGGLGTEDSEGFSIEPTLGAEFFVTDRFSVALEAFLYHRETDADSSFAGSEESESTGTDTRLLVRFFL
jgi:hypothetical protein